MEQNHNPFAPEAATDEPASLSNPEPARDDAEARQDSAAASPEAERLYWKAYMDGARAAGREPGHPHMPADFSLDLSRVGSEPGLTSTKLLDPWPEAVPVPGAAPVPTGYGNSLPPESAASRRAVRADGWTDERIVRFLSSLAETGVVADACRACGMSRDAAYALRNRASGRAFAIAWDAAQLLSRRAVADDVMSRARHGVIDRVYRNGELVAERHRYDNRLTMAVLARLDRLAEGHGENAPVIRAVAQEFDQFLDILPQGNEAAQAFLEERFPSPSPSMGEVRVGVDRATRSASPKSPRPRPNAAPTPTLPHQGGGGRDEISLLGRLATYEEFGVGLLAELDTDDLDPAEMESWTDGQMERAMLSGFLAKLRPLEWPEAARNPPRDGEGDHPQGGGGGPEADGTDGMCKLRKLYLLHCPQALVPDEASLAEPEYDFADCSVWEEEEGEWLTDFPPPDGFDGFEQGEPGDEDYRRALTEEELKAIGADEQTLEAERSELLAEQKAARMRYFGFDESRPEPADATE
jgi:hypothetical protein